MLAVKVKPGATAVLAPKSPKDNARAFGCGHGKLVGSGGVGAGGGGGGGVGGGTQCLMVAGGVFFSAILPCGFPACVMAPLMVSFAALSSAAKL